MQLGDHLNNKLRIGCSALSVATKPPFFVLYCRRWTRTRTCKWLAYPSPCRTCLYALPAPTQIRLPLYKLCVDTAIMMNRMSEAADILPRVFKTRPTPTATRYENDYNVGCLMHPARGFGRRMSSYVHSFTLSCELTAASVSFFGHMSIS